MRVMLLAAGRSTRLGAIGQLLPKPLLPICGYPAIRFGLAACAAAGLRDIVINLYHHGDLIRQALGDGTDYGVRIQYSPENELLGTAGGIAHAAARLGGADEDVLVMNAKVVADVDLPALVRAHHLAATRSTPPARATLLLRDDPLASQWGPITVDRDGRVIGILDAVIRADAAGEAGATEPAAVRMFTGIQVIGAPMRARMRPVSSDTVRDAFIPALQAGERLQSEVLRGYFAEHSTPERYLAGNLALLRNPSALRHPPGPLVGVEAGARIHEQAVIVNPVRIARGAVIEARAVVGPDVVIGHDAIVATGATVTRAVVWPRARVSGDLRDAVITSQGVYDAPPTEP